MIENNLDLRDRMKKVWPILLGAGVKTVKLEYSGSGDSGMFELPEYEPSDTVNSSVGDIQVETMTKSSTFDRKTSSWTQKIGWVQMSLSDTMTDIASDFVSYYHGGWENNEGGRGTVEFDCEQFTVGVKHEEYVIQSIHSAHEQDARPPDLEFIAMMTRNTNENA